MILDDEELKATRKFLGLDKKQSIEKDIKILNGIDIKFLLSANIEQSNFIIDEANKINKAIYHLLQDYTRQKQRNKEHQKINGELREKVKELEDKYILEKVAKEGTEELLENTIPIFKIENEIKELKADLNNVFEKFKSTNKIDFKLHDKGIFYEGQIKALEKLLKESEEE